MSTGLSAFDTTVQEANLWLKHVEQRLDANSRQEAYAGLRAVLHALRDGLSGHEAINFAAQLPMILRGLFFEGWTLPERRPVRSLDDFAEFVTAKLPGRPVFDVFVLIRAVFSAIEAFTGAGEPEKLRTQLPESIAAFWRQELLEDALSGRFPDV